MADGLRERKRREARRAMERAAVDLAFDEGVQAVTVDRVCAAALVSRSTFFNYFASLDEAIFGSPLDYDRASTDAVLAEHGGDLVVAASVIVMEAVRSQSDDDVTRRRIALLVREPEHTGRVSWGSTESREPLVAVIESWLDEHPRDARLRDDDHAGEARLTVGLSIALGDELLRRAHRVDGEIVIELADMRAARARMSAILASS